MADFQAPPTYAEVILTSKDPKTGETKVVFNPIWLKWFVDIAAFVSASGGGGGGAVVHNSTSGLQGGTANQFYHMTAAEDVLVSASAASTYTPTLTNVANLAASTAYLAQYMRYGGFVVVSGQADVDPTLPGVATQLGISLPVASNFANAFECGGAAFAPGIAGQGAAILGDAANNRAEMQWISGDVTNQAMFFIFGYRVI